MTQGVPRALSPCGTWNGHLSQLKLDQVRVLLRAQEVDGRHVFGRGKFADGHGGLIAGVAASAADAVLENLVAEGAVFGEVKVEVLEEAGNAGEEADAADAAGFGLVEDGLNEEAAGSVAFDVGANDDGADLGEMRAVDVEGSAADELVGVGLDDGEGADVLADLGVGAAEEGAVVGEAIDELMDGVGVLQLRGARVHGGLSQLAGGGGDAGGRQGCGVGAG
jgi:hypothetical protein